MALVLVEGERQIAEILNASNASTDATSDSNSQVGFAQCRATVFITVLGLLLVVLL
jgi:hypothetical protein